MKIILTLAIFLATAILPERAPAADPAESAAIASLLSVGLAGAPNKFANVRGAADGINSDGDDAYKVTFNPGPSYFRTCVEIGEDESWILGCISTPRTESLASLFARIPPIVSAYLPQGYEKGTSGTTADGVLYRTWRCGITYYKICRVGSPDVVVYFLNGVGGPVYRIEVATPGT